MFFPRSSPSLASSHLDASTPPPPEHATSRVTSTAKAGEGGARRVSSGAWSQPTTAPASVQVHYHYLAGRYRDLSYERGLGLTRSDLPLSGSNATLRGIPEGERDEDDGRSLSSSSSSKAKSASNSLRAIARKSGLNGGVESDETYSSKRLEDLFLGGRGIRERRLNGGGGGGAAERANTSLAAGMAMGEPSKPKTGPIGAKHGSLRSYAEERIKAHELIETRIQRATDTGRLKWEAKAAMLNNSYGLAVLLFLRAAQLGSVSACLSLSHLYSKGIIRGSKPVVVLIHRDPLRSLSWALEASRLLEARAGAKAKRWGEPAAVSSVEADQPLQIVALLARLLRCTQMGLTAPEDVPLPPVRKSRAGDGESSKAQGGRLWESVCSSMAWLDFQLPLLAPVLRDDGESIGPDDDDNDAEGMQRIQARTQIALIEAVVATRRFVFDPRENNDGTALTRMQSCWANFASKVKSEAQSHAAQQGDLLAICRGSEKLLKLGAKGERAVVEFSHALEASLLEAEVPVSFSSAQSRPAKLVSPSKRRAGRLVRRRLSLEELTPMDDDARRLRDRAMRPTLIKHHSQREAKPTASVTDISASAKSLHPLRTNRAVSLHGSAQRPNLLPSSGTLARLDVYGEKERSSAAFQHFKRPASVMSDSPSLLFASREDDGTEEEGDRGEGAETEKGAGLTATTSIASSLWEGETAVQSRPSRPGTDGQARKRVSSLYGTPSVAPPEDVYTEGSTTFDYDIESSLRRQQARRHRGDSNASISTVASMLSTNPSIAESMGEIDYARGQFSASTSRSSNINGFDLRLGGAADTLRRIRKTSQSEGASRDGPAAPQLTETLEQLIANSTSYRAVDSSSRSRKNSTASLRSLTAFTSNNQRQNARGDLRPPSLFSIGRAGPGRSPSMLAVPTTLTDRNSTLRSPTLVSPSASNATATGKGLWGASKVAASASLSSSSAMGGGGGALGSLKLLGRQSGGPSLNRKPIPSEMITTTTMAKTAEEEPAERAQVESLVSKKGEEETERNGSSRRAFASIDPTRSESGTPKTMASLSPPLSHRGSSSDLTAGGGTNQHSINSTLDAALAEAEDRSGLKTTSCCIVCQKSVVNAPVSKSGDVFCSRDCRIEMKRRRMADSSNSGKGKDREGRLAATVTKATA